MFPNSVSCVTSVILLSSISFSNSRRIGDKFLVPQYSSMSSEDYGYYPNDDYYHHEQREPEPYRNFRDFHPLGNLYPHPPLFHEEPQRMNFDRFRSDSEEHYFHRDSFFDPRAGLLETPLETMFEPMEKPTEERVDQMGTIGEKISERMRKPAGELTKEMEKMANGTNGNKSSEAPILAAPTDPSSGDPQSPENGKMEDQTVNSEKKPEGEGQSTPNPPEKQTENDTAGVPVTPTAQHIKIMEHFERMRDETHDKVHDEPQTRRMEWAAPSFAEIPYAHHHPRFDYVDYYDD